MNKDFLAALFIKAIGAMDDAALGSLMRESMAAKARGAQNLDAAEIVRDMFLEGQLHKVPSKGELEVTSPVSASGGGADNMVERFSDPATQLKHVADYDKISNMLGDLANAVKALMEKQTSYDANMKELSNSLAAFVKKADEEDEEDEEEGGINIAVENDEEEEEGEEGKSLAVSVANSIMTKAEEEEEEEEEESEKAEDEDGEEEEEEEEGKSLSDPSKIKFAKAMLDGSKKALAKGKTARVREEAGKSLRRALGLATEAAKSKDKTLAKAANAVLEGVRETMFLHSISAKARKARKDSLPDTGNQKKWPAKDKFEKSLVSLETDLHTLMNTVANLSKMRQAAGASADNVVPINPLAKSGNDYFNEKTALIMSKANSGQLSDLVHGEAEELMGLMQAAKAGKLDDSVVRNAIAVASAEVKALFPEWAQRAA